MYSNILIIFNMKSMNKTQIEPSIYITDARTLNKNKKPKRKSVKHHGLKR